MSPAVVAFLFAAGAATWVYSRIHRSTGGNSQSSMVVAGVTFLFAFIAFLLILNAVERSLN